MLCTDGLVIDDSFTRSGVKPMSVSERKTDSACRLELLDARAICASLPSLGTTAINSN